MLYRAPNARISLFDNSDVIVTSFDGKPCNFSTTNLTVCLATRPNTDFQFCSRDGVAGENACDAYNGNNYICNNAQFVQDCDYLWELFTDPCTGEGDHYSTNSAGNLF